MTASVQGNNSKHTRGYKWTLFNMDYTKQSANLSDDGMVHERRDEQNKNVVRRLQVSKKKNPHNYTLQSEQAFWFCIERVGSDIRENASHQAFRRTLQIRHSGERFRSDIQENASYQAFGRTLQIRQSGERFRSGIRENASDQTFRRTLQIRHSGERFRSDSQENASHQAFGRRL